MILASSLDKNVGQITRSRGQKVGQILKSSILLMLITPLIFELDRRTKSLNVGNGIAYLDVGLNFRYNFLFKSSPYLKMVAILKILNILDRFILTTDMERMSEINPQKALFMLMTSLITSQRVGQTSHN